MTLHGAIANSPRRTCAFPRKIRARTSGLSPVAFLHRPARWKTPQPGEPQLSPQIDFAFNRDWLVETIVQTFEQMRHRRFSFVAHIRKTKCLAAQFSVPRIDHQMMSLAQPLRHGENVNVP